LYGEEGEPRKRGRRTKEEQAEVLPLFVRIIRILRGALFKLTQSVTVSESQCQGGLAARIGVKSSLTRTLPIFPAFP
jgi:hypothetical protein